MRYLYLIITLFIVSCTSVPKEYLSNDAICNYDNSIFKITEDEMFFNVNRLKARELILVKNNSKQLLGKLKII